jgi:hypothetical protein
MVYWSSIPLGSSERPVTCIRVILNEDRGSWNISCVGWGLHQLPLSPILLKERVLGTWSWKHLSLWEWWANNDSSKILQRRYHLWIRFTSSCKLKHDISNHDIMIMYEFMYKA